MREDPTILGLQKDAAVARLEAYQQKLGAALAKGRPAYDLLFDAAPPGVGLHEIALVTLALVERYLRDPQDAIVGIRTGLMPVILLETQTGANR